MHSKLKAKIDETTQFIKKHQIVIAVSVTAVGTYAITRDLKTSVVNEQIAKLTTWNLENEIEHLRLMEFVDAKGLRNEFFEFCKTGSSI